MAWSLNLLLSIAIVVSAAYRINTDPRNYGRQNITGEVVGEDLDPSYVTYPHKLAKREATQPKGLIKPTYVPSFHKSCENLTYCELDSDSGYPQELVDQAIEQILKAGYTVSLQVDDVPTYEDRVAGPLSTKQPLCLTTSKMMIFPKYGMDVKGNKYELINRHRGNNPVQGFRVSICEEAGCGCRHIDTYETDYTASCFQHYENRQATAFKLLNNNQLKLFPVQITLPSHCECLAKRI